MMEESSSVLLLKSYLKISGLTIICSVAELFVNKHSDRVQGCPAPVEAQ